MDAQATYGGTPLHWAAWKGHLAMAKLLLANGAKADARDIDGRTPLYRAARNYRQAVAKLLVAKGAALNAKANHGLSPLNFLPLDFLPELAEIVKQMEAEKASKKQPAQPKVATP